jgi:RNA polymerase sigma-70 factor (ECF subfamily)
MADLRGFEQTAIPHMPLLYNYALKLTMNSEDAKDLLQDTYLRAYRFWNKFEQGTNVRGWLCRVMKNSYINLYRTKAKEPKQVEYDEARFAYDIPNHLSLAPKYQRGKSLDDIFEDEIVRCMESLPGIFRSVVLLSDVEELRYEEIAEMVSCPVGTARSRLHRGRKVLQKNLLNFARANGYLARKFEDSDDAQTRKSQGATAIHQSLLSTRR